MSDAKKIASKLLEKLLPAGATDAERAALRADPTKYKQYLDALDKVEGPRAERAKSMGFGNRKWYHGSSTDIPAFEKEALGASTNAQSAKQGFFFASDPSTASDYAELAKERGVSKESIREGSAYRQVQDFEDRMNVKYGPGFESKLSNEDYQKYADLQAQYENVQLGATDTPRDKALKKIKDQDYELGNLTQKYSRLTEQHENTSKILERVRKSKDPMDIERLPELEAKAASQQNDIEALNQRSIQLRKEYDSAKDTAESVGQQVGEYRLKGSPENIRVKNYGGESYRDSTYADEMRWAKNEGKTGVLFKNTYDPADPNNRVKQDIAAVFEPNQIRSTNAAFDPRFKDSADVLALDNQAAKTVGGLIASKIAKPTFGLGEAFSQINEPLEQLNEPRNRAIQIAAQALGKQMDVSGGKVPGLAQQNADVLETVGQMVVPASQDLVMGPANKVFMGAKAIKKGTKAAEIAEKAATKLEQAVAKGYKPTAAEAEAVAKFRGIQTVLPTAQEAATKRAELALNKPVKTLFNEPPKHLGALEVDKATGGTTRKLPLKPGSGL